MDETEARKKIVAQKGKHQVALREEPASHVHDVLRMLAISKPCQHISTRLQIGGWERISDVPSRHGILEGSFLAEAFNLASVVATAVNGFKTQTVRCLGFMFHDIIQNTKCQLFGF